MALGEATVFGVALGEVIVLGVGFGGAVVCGEFSKAIAPLSQICFIFSFVISISTTLRFTFKGFEGREICLPLIVI